MKAAAVRRAMAFAAAAFLVLLVVVVSCFIVVVDPPLTHKSKTFFITYGDNNFKNSKQRLRKEAEATNLFDHVIVYEPQDVEKILANAPRATLDVFHEKRGGGFWIWKPLILQEQLKHMNEGDVLIYADAGCTLLNKQTDISNTISSIKKHDIGISHCKSYSSWSRKFYGRKDVVTGLVTDVDKFYSSNDESSGLEYQANRLIVQKRPSSVDFIDRWAKVAYEKPRWFTDDKSAIPNTLEFVEHRHDQTIYNALAIELDVSGETCNFNTWLRDARIRG